MRALLLLAVDTATARGSVALAEAGAVVAELRLDREAAHSRWLLPAVTALLEWTHHTPAELEAFAVTVGPGSFTGLRVGIGSVQGLALAGQRPCLGVSTLDVLAQRAGGAAERIVAVMDAYRGQVFTADYDAAARPQQGPAIEEPEALAQRLGDRPVALIGDGAFRHRELLASSCPAALFVERSLFLAGSLARLAAPRLAAGEGSPAGELRALYVREPAIRLPARAR